MLFFVRVTCQLRHFYFCRPVALYYLLRSDIVDLCLSSFLLKVRHSKTIQFGQRLLTIPFVSCADERICLVSMLIRLLGKNPLPGSVALFSFSSGNRVTSLTHSTFVLKLRALLGRLGYRSTDFSGHSFRRGGCSFCFEAGINISEIKLRGDWKSQSYEKYLHIPAKADF